MPPGTEADPAPGPRLTQRALGGGGGGARVSSKSPRVTPEWVPVRVSPRAGTPCICPRCGMWDVGGPGSILGLDGGSLLGWLPAHFTSHRPRSNLPAGP